MTEMTDMMACPKCGSYYPRTIYVRRKKNGRIRRKACNDCGHRYSTIEIYLDEYLDFKNRPETAEEGSTP